MGLDYTIISGLVTRPAIFFNTHYYTNKLLARQGLTYSFDRHIIEIRYLFTTDMEL